ADRNRSHWSTSKTPSYTKSVSWQHHRRFPQFRRKIISISAFEFIIQPVAVTLNESINALACWVIDSDAPTAFTCTKQRFDIFSIKIDCSRNHVFATVSRSERFCRVIHSLDFSRLWTMLI
ncbi:hypothetical protein, partial [Klebsiella aerogenes]|uniref:hypothetical protein n=1 Tax=Klebsiella aerogenes TaxID=548 RepID=UPI001D0D6DC3